MHILLLTKNYPPQIGGIEKYAYDLYNSLLEKTKIQGEIESGSFIKNSETNLISPGNPVNQVSSVKLIAAGPRNEYLLTKSGSYSKQATVDSKRIKKYSLQSTVHRLQSIIYRVLYILSELSRLSWFAVRAITAGTLWCIKTMNGARGTNNEILIWSLDGSIAWLGLLVKKITCIVAPLTRGVNVAQGVMTRVTIHGTDIVWNKKLYQATIPKIVANMDEVYAISENIKAEAAKRGIPENKITIQQHSLTTLNLPHLVDFDKKNFLLQNDVPVDKMLLFSLGRFVELKGFHWFISEILPYLDERFCYILGGIGPLQNMYENIIYEKGLRNIKFLGPINDDTLKAKWYSSCDYFIMPNIQSEGFGLVLLEAQFYGLTIIASKIDGIETRVGENDVVLPMKDAKKWISYVNSLQ